MNIYIGNLSSTVTSEMLRKSFEAFGAVGTVKIIIDRVTGQPKGFGFVDMPNNDEAQQAIAELNGKEIEGQKVRVNEARPLEQRAPRRDNNRPFSQSTSRGQRNNDFGRDFRNKRSY